MSSEQSLVVIGQKEVVFYGDSLSAIKADDGQIYAGLSQMCRALGLDTQAQRRRIERHAVLSKGLQGVANLATPGGIQRGYVLRVDLVPLWLSGIRVSSVSEDIREKLTIFQEKAAAVLWEAFKEMELSTGDDDLLAMMDMASPEAVETYQIFKGLMQLARNQIVLEAKITQRLEGVDYRLGEQERRLERIEAELGDTGRAVTEDQAMQISQAVKAIAVALGKQTGRNEFGAVYGEFYRRFGITSYKLLPARKFSSAMTYFTNWYQEITDESDVPF